jgi:LytS/YehU family sensor histidine kinase
MILMVLNQITEIKVIEHILMRLKDLKNIFNQKIIFNNEKLFPRIILEPMGIKSNYFGEDLHLLF